MVRNTNANAAKMVSLIPRIHSWAVTGTPIAGHEFNEIAGIMQFVQVPIHGVHRQFWNQVCSPSLFKIMLGYFQQFMHRMTKERVQDEINVPPQSQIRLFIDFSEIERHNYQSIWYLSFLF